MNSSPLWLALLGSSVMKPIKEWLRLFSPTLIALLVVLLVATVFDQDIQAHTTTTSVLLATLTVVEDDPYGGCDNRFETIDDCSTALTEDEFTYETTNTLNDDGTKPF